MRRVLELEYNEVVFGLTLDSLRFAYKNNIPLFYTENSFSSPPIYDFTDPEIKIKEYNELYAKVSLLGLIPAIGQSARLEDANLLKLMTFENLAINITFNKLWLTNIGALNLEGMPSDYQMKNFVNLVADKIGVRSGLYHDYWQLETDGDDFVKKIVFFLSDRFFYKNIDNKKDCVALSLIKNEDMDIFEYSELAARMKTANFMEKAGIKGRWDKTNGYFKKIKLDSIKRFVYPSYTLSYKNLPENIQIISNISKPEPRESLYGEIQKIQVQQN